MVIKPFSISKFSFKILTTGARQLVVQDAAEIILSSFFNSEKDLSVDYINKTFIESSKKKLKDILEVTDQKLVSIDFNHNSASAIIDSSLTSVVGKNMGKISAWYDNEWGFSNRMCDLVKYIHKI